MPPLCDGRTCVRSSPAVPCPTKAAAPLPLRRRTPRRFALQSALGSWLALLFFLIATLSVRAQDTYEAYSPVVSYVFEDTLASADAYSPVVSYVFAEALPDDVAATFGSAPVSYLYLSPGTGPAVVIAGRVFDEGGQGLAGARVTAAVNPLPLAETVTDAEGRFALPSLAAGPYGLRASKAGYAPAGRVLETGAGLKPQDFVLRALPAAPLAERTTAPVPEKLQPRPVRVTAAQLKVFQGGAWVPFGQVRRDRMTLVLTHGWIVCGDRDGGIAGWPTRMARQLAAANLAGAPNLVAWDWREEADTCLRSETDGAIGPPIDRTRGQGLALGKALHETLGADYARPVHFLGHSLGALVNTEAANYLHGDGATVRARAPQPWDPQRTHMTLFDEAEVLVVAGQRARAGARFGSDFAGLRTASLPVQIAGGALGFTVAAINDWRNPIPVRSAWVDNYLSLVGINHPAAVNVCLQQSSFAALRDLDAAKAHGVPMPWYGDTIAEPDLSFMGFTNSFELRDRMPPPGADHALGRLYLQSGGVRDPHDLRAATDDDFTECQQQLALLIGRESLQTVAAGVRGTVRFAGDVTVRTGGWIADRISAGYSSVQQAGDASLDALSNPGLRLELRTGLPPVFGGQIVRHGEAGGATNSPAYAWLKVAVPTDAVFLVFDFTVSGDGADDSVLSGVEGTNRFNLETKFVAPDVRTSSSQMDVSAWAGREAELFFGLLGGSSTNCAVTVEGIRFLTLAPPELALTLAKDQSVALSWPSAAVGYAVERAPSPGATDWSALPQAPALFAGRFSVTNTVTGEAQFFRLRRQ